MKKTLYILTGMALSTLMMSCEDINEGGKDRLEQIPVQMKATIQPYDKDVSEIWQGGEELGMFMFGSDENISQASCIRLQTDAEGVLSPVGTGEMPLYPEDASKVSFICFHPYDTNAATSRTLNLKVGSKSTGEKSDYLYSNNARNKYPSLTPVKLQMGHVLSMVKFVITADNNISASTLRSLNPRIENVPTEGVFSMTDGTLTSTSGQGSIALTTNESVTQAQGLVLPASFNFTVRCDVDGMPLSRKLGNMTFESGKLYTFDLHVSTPGFEISLRGIEDWKVEKVD